MELLNQTISAMIYDVLIRLQGKLLTWEPKGQWSLKIKLKLSMSVDEMDINMAKPLLIDVYPSKPSDKHKFPLGVCMCLVPEIDSVLNQKDQKNVAKHPGLSKLLDRNWLLLKHGKTKK